MAIIVLLPDLGSWFNPHLGNRQRTREGLMDKDPEMEMITDASEDGHRVDGAQLDQDDQVMVILEHWRSAWTDLCRTEAVVAQGPSFAFWDSNVNGFENPGAFFSADAIDQLIPPEEVREMVRKHMDVIDHAREMSIVLVLREGAGARAAVAVIPKTAECQPQAWFEMGKIRKTSVTQKVWIPLRAESMICREGEYGYEGFLEEYFGVGSVMFELEHREQINELGWSDIGGNSFTGGLETTYVWPDRAHSTTDGDADQPKEKPGSNKAEQGKLLASFRVPFINLNLNLNVRSTQAEAATPALTASPPESGTPAEPQRISTYYWAGDWGSHHGDAVGTGLVIDQSFDGVATSEWHLHQDFVISLGLQRQGDVWLRPAEGFQEVVRLSRNDAGEPVLLEVRSEHLRDYLKARGMYLLMSSFRSRHQIVSDAAHIDWAEELVEEEMDADKWEGLKQPIHEGGSQYGSSTAVFHASRTDIDADDEVPVLGFPNDDSVVSKSWTVQHQGKKLFSLRGSLWKTELVEPGRVSERVLGEQPPNRVDFAVDGSGERVDGAGLVDRGCWLWFRPSVTTLLSSYRGFSLSWCTRDTGFIGISRGYSVHFGLNDLGLINVYGKDIGQLPLWQQRVWAGANVAPDGGVSEELLASQAKAEPADTQAPETRLRPAYNALNEAFEKLTGKPLFAPHHAISDIFDRIHRFRALEKTGVLELAKDLARVTVESLDGVALSVLATPPGKMKAGSVKHLEAVLQKEVSQDEARAMTKVLVGINELRQADAHLPSFEFGKAYGLVGIDQHADLDVVKGRVMLESLVVSLVQMEEILSRLRRESK